MALQALHSQPLPKVSGFLTLAANKKSSTLMGKMCSLLPLNHRVHKDDCFLFKGFFINHLPPTIKTHLMREEISNPRKLAA